MVTRLDGCLTNTSPAVVYLLHFTHLHTTPTIKNTALSFNASKIVQSPCSGHIRERAYGVDIHDYSFLPSRKNKQTMAFGGVYVCACEKDWLDDEYDDVVFFFFFLLNFFS